MDKVTSPMSTEVAHGSKWYSQFSVPDFSKRTMENLSKGEIKRSVGSEIVTAIGIQMWSHTHYPTSQEYTGVLRMLVEKYPVLKDKFGNGIVSDIFFKPWYIIISCTLLQLLLVFKGSWKEQLRQKFSNMRRPPRQEDTVNTVASNNDATVTQETMVGQVLSYNQQIMGTLER